MAGAAGSTIDTLGRDLAAEERNAQRSETGQGRAAPPLDDKHALIRRILSRQRDFDFYQLLHLLEQFFPDVTPIGRHGPVDGERIRIRPDLNLNFPAGDIASIEWLDGKAIVPDRLLITTTFMGLYGTNSPLPTHFTERLMSYKDDPDEYDKDDRERGFLDLLHHRIYSLLYRVWVKYRYYVTFHGDGNDNISQVVRGLLGIGTACGANTLGDRLKQVHPVRLFRYVGAFSQRPRTAGGLEGIIRDWLGGESTVVIACVGRWLRIEPSDQNRMGLGKCSLGSDFLTGERIFDRSGKFRVQLGPVDYATFEQFLPDQPKAATLAELVRLYLDDPLDFDIEVILKGEQVPEMPASAVGSVGRLGYTTWLRSKPTPDKSVIFRPPIAAEN